MTTHPMSELCTTALQIAIKEIGVTEEKGNKGPRVTQYLNSIGLDGGYSWCAAFVYWCFNQAAIQLKVVNPLVKTGGVLKHAQKTTGIKVKIPRAGDIFILDHGHGMGHTGMVKAVSADSKSYTTVEGNSNNTGSRKDKGVQ